jgi:hypothetical protein
MASFFQKPKWKHSPNAAKRLDEAWKVENFTLLGSRTPRDARVFCPVDALC